MSLYNKQENYKAAKQKITNLLMDIIENNKITEEHKKNINDLNTEYVNSKSNVENDIDQVKQSVEIDKELYIQSKIEELKTIIEKSSDKIQIGVSGTENNKEQISQILIDIEGITTRVGDAETNVNSTVQRIEPWFYLSTSRTELIGGSWSNISPISTEGKYLWSKNKTYYTDTKKEPTYSQAVCMAGNKGDKGDKGDTGQQGLQGLQGEQGEKGIPGTNG
ncbi:hypothetical protein, partial [Terrisporobacter sp.]|uniref:hypothetical protein n=1 Tax=Terrisporobacter sp. TaxID=1965305 RepID=UPI002F417DD1